MATTEERLTALETSVADLQNEMNLRVKTTSLTSTLKSITLKQQSHDTEHVDYETRLGNLERNISVLYTTITSQPTWDGVHVGAHVTADYTVQDETLITADSTSAAITITIPGASTVPWRQIGIKKADTSTNSVTIATADSSTIDGAATKVLSTSYESVTLVSNGVNWFILA